VDSRTVTAAPDPTQVHGSVLCEPETTVRAIARLAEEVSRLVANDLPGLAVNNRTLVRMVDDRDEEIDVLRGRLQWTREQRTPRGFLPAFGWFLLGIIVGAVGTVVGMVR
jgi:hypothetical protein